MTAQTSAKEFSRRHKILEQQGSRLKADLRDFILGWQDGLVNNLGLILGVAIATNERRVVLISGIALLFAESISMAAVAFTSQNAVRDYYQRMVEQEKREMREVPEKERDEIREIYQEKGFSGKELESIVKKITSDEKVWLDTMMAEEIRLFPEETRPLESAAVVGLSAVIGSAIPLLPFFVLPVKAAIPVTLLLSAGFLFLVGMAKARLTVGDGWKSGIQMLVIGLASALIGYLIGVILGAQTF